MVKRVIWSPLAHAKRKEILEYWIERNKSKSYSIKLNSLFKQAVKLIVMHPYVGKPTDIARVRVKIVRDYLMFYELKDSEIHILTIWDSRQNPDRLKLK